MDVTPTNSWSDDALLIKAQRYCEQMHLHAPSDWQFALWSCFTLEFLARAALSHVSPALLADHRSWHNTYYALGHMPNASKFTPKSISVADVLSRLGEIYPTFSSDLVAFCVAHVARRNSELHSGDSPYEGLKQSTWLATYYKASAILLGTMKKELADLFGADAAILATKLIESAADEAAKAVSGKIKSHRTVWNEKEAGEKSLLQKQAEAWATKHNGHRVKCPACGTIAILQGEPISPPSVTLEDDFIVEKQQYLPNKFECVACSLKISGLSYLGEAGLSDVYIRKTEYDPAEYYAPDEEWTEYEDDNNEPFW